MKDPELADLDDITPDEALLADVHRTRLTTPATRVLLSLVVIAAAFYGGALLAKSQNESTTSSSAQALISQIRAAVGGASGASGASASGAPTRLGGAGGGTFGTVKLVDGTNVYVQDAEGNTIKVTTNPSTTVSVTKTGKTKDLAPGSSVIVQGKQSSDGSSMAATSISQTTGFGGGAGGPFGARGGGGLPTAAGG